MPDPSPTPPTAATPEREGPDVPGELWGLIREDGWICRLFRVEPIQAFSSEKAVRSYIKNGSAHGDLSDVWSPVLIGVHPSHRERADIAESALSAARADVARVTAERDRLIDSLIVKNDEEGDHDVLVPVPNHDGVYKITSTTISIHEYRDAVSEVRKAAGLPPTPGTVRDEE